MSRHDMDEKYLDSGFGCLDFLYSLSEPSSIAAEWRPPGVMWMVYSATPQDLEKRSIVAISTRSPERRTSGWSCVTLLFHKLANGNVTPRSYFCTDKNRLAQDGNLPLPATFCRLVLRTNHGEVLERVGQRSSVVCQDVGADGWMSQCVQNGMHSRVVFESEKAVGPAEGLGGRDK